MAANAHSMALHWIVRITGDENIHACIKKIEDGKFRSGVVQYIRFAMEKNRDGSKRLQCFVQFKQRVEDRTLRTLFGGLFNDGGSNYDIHYAITSINKEGFGELIEGGFEWEFGLKAVFRYRFRACFFCTLSLVVCLI